MIRFNEVNGENFMPFEEVTVKLDGQGITAVTGKTDRSYSDSNGAGKSGIFEMLYWGCFGKTMRGTAADEVVNNKAGKDCRVAVGFYVDNGDYILIERFRKHHSGKNSLRLLRSPAGSDSPVDETCLDTKDTQAKIVAYLGIDEKLFGSTVVFGGDELKAFLYARDAGRKALFERLLGLGRYEKAFKKAGEKIDALTQKVNLHAQQGVQAMERREEARQEIERLQHEHDRYEADRAQRLAEAQSALESAVAASAALKEWEAYQSQWAQHKASLQAYKKTLEEQAETTMETWKPAIADVADRHQKSVDEARRLASEVDRATALIEAGKCDKCGKPQDTSDTAARDALVVERDRADGAVKQVAAQVADLEAERDGVISQITEALAKADEQIQEADEKLGEAAIPLAQHGQAAQHEALYRERVENLKTDANPHAESLALARQRFSAEEEKLKKSGQEKDRVTQEREHYFFWREGFGRKGIRSFLLDSVMPEVNARATEYAQILTDGQISVAFTTQSPNSKGEMVEKFDVLVFSENGGGSYEASSGGERRRIELCVALAIHDLIVAQTGGVNCVLLDEVFDSLDATGSERVVELLAAKAKNCGLTSTFVITHNRDVANMFSKTWRVVNEAGVSRLEV